LVKLLCTRLDGDKLFRRYKDLHVEKMNLGGKVESMVAEKDGLAKVVADLEARLKESKSRLEESELWVGKEREAAWSLRKS